MWDRTSEKSNEWTPMDRLDEALATEQHELDTVLLRLAELRVANEELGELARTDALTSVPNRAAFDDHLARTITAAVRRGEGSVGLLMFDIDRFKSFNDTYGHQLGDEVLRQVALTMRDTARGNELFARYGGEEFALVIANCKIEEVMIAGDRFRAAVEDLVIPSEAGDLRVTISGGASHLSLIGDRDAGERLIKAADEAMYQAKEAGRNRICGAPESSG